MLESLTDRLGKALRNLRGVGKLTEENMEAALTEVRSALLSADVHFRVARQFIESVKTQVVGLEVIKSVSPGQMVIKIIHDELVKLLGEGTCELVAKKPLKIMLIGLQGSGKTTCSAKLGLHLEKQGHKAALVACDPYRPAAIDQIEFLANKQNFLVYSERGHEDVAALAGRAQTALLGKGATALIFDTAGRLQLDSYLIDELKQIKAAIQPDEILLVADSALGQEAVNVAKTFNEAVQITGIILTKVDGDARGGAALSMKSITQVPIKFMGTGEKVEEFERFHPDRIASRILGMGDVVSLVERAQETIDQKEAARLAEKMAKAEFDYEDFLAQMRQISKLGSLGSIMGMIPGMSGVKIGDAEEKKMKRTEALILSMTVKERRNPNLINASRRDRIARGAGLPVKDLNALIKQFTEMRKMMQMMQGPKGMRMMKEMAHKMKGMPGMDKLGL
jgi:signal recognition particle subunit SRP54